MRVTKIDHIGIADRRIVKTLQRCTGHGFQRD
jgi:hypothetical protein